MTRQIVRPNEGGARKNVAKKLLKRTGLGPKNGLANQPKANAVSGSNDGGKGPTGRGRGKPGGTNYGAMGNYPGVRYSEAASLVNAQLKPQIRDIRNERQKLRRETQFERQRAYRNYNQTTGDLNHIFSETGDYIGSQNQAIQDQYSGLTDRTTQAQAALMQHLQENGAGAVNGVTSELSRLGIEGGADLGAISNDQQFMEGQAAINGQSMQANIGLQQAGASDVGNLLMGMTAGSRASSLGQAANAKSAALFEAEAAKKQGVEQLQRAMKDLRTSRPDLVRQMMEQMQESRWGQYMDSQNLDMQREQLNMQRAAQRAYQKSSASRYSSGGSSYPSGGSSTYAPGGGSGSSDVGGGGSDGSSGNGTGNPTGGSPNYGDLVTQILNGGGWGSGGGGKSKPKPPKRKRSRR